MFSFEVDLFPAAKESKEVKTLQLQGAPTQMKVFRDSISLMVNNDMIQLLEYDGINGLVVAGTVKVTDVKVFWDYSTGNINSPFNFEVKYLPLKGI